MTGTTNRIVYSALIAAIYAALTMVLAPISYGALQFRVSEALCILPFFFPASAWGLFAGCAISNIISSAGILDIVFGSLSTLLAGLCTAAIGKSARKKTEVSVGEAAQPVSWGACIAACSMPVLFNGPIVGAELAYLFPLDDGFWYSFLVFGAQVALGEIAVLYLLGLPLMRFLLNNKRFSGFFYGL